MASEQVVVYLGETCLPGPWAFGWQMRLQWLDGDLLPLGDYLVTRVRHRPKFHYKTAVAMPRDAAARFLMIRLMKKRKLLKAELVAEHYLPLPSNALLLNASIGLLDAPCLTEYTRHWKPANGEIHMLPIHPARDEPTLALSSSEGDATSVLKLRANAQQWEETSPKRKQRSELLKSLAGTEKDAAVPLEIGMRVEEAQPVAPGTVFRWSAVHEKPGWLLRKGSLSVDVCLTGVTYNEIVKLQVSASIGSQVLPLQNALPKSDCVLAKQREHRIRFTFALIAGEVPSEVLITFKGILSARRTAFVETRPLQLVWTEAQATDARAVTVADTAVEPLGHDGIQVKMRSVAVVDEGAEWRELWLGSLDCTPTFLAEMERVRSMTSEQFVAANPGMEKPLFMLVGGLFTAFYPGYFAPNLKVLKELGVDFRRIPVKTECGCSVNADIIRKEVQQVDPKKPIVLIAHSKGGTDIHRAFALHPELAERVSGMLLFQPVFSGTMGVDEGVAKLVEKANIKFMSGQASAIEDLSYDNRFTMVRTSPFPTDIPTVCFASFLAPAEEAESVMGILVEKAMKVTNNISRSKTRFNTDGLMVRADARVPASHQILLSDVAHGAPAFEVPGAKYPAGVLMKAGMAVLVTKMREAGVLDGGLTE